MFQERKDYRKKFTSSGRIYLGGEELDFTSYDVSVKGLRIELMPGGLITEFNDIKNLMQEISVAEIYVKELMLSGEVDIAWVDSEEGRIIMGLEFRDVIYNAHKLWRKRRFYRKAVNEKGRLIIDDAILDFTCRDLSADGMQLHLQNAETVDAGFVVKLVYETRGIKALAKVIWKNSDTEGAGAVIGIRFLIIE